MGKFSQVARSSTQYDVEPVYMYVMSWFLILLGELVNRSIITWMKSVLMKKLSYVDLRPKYELRLYLKRAEDAFFVNCWNFIVSLKLARSKLKMLT